MKNLVYFLIQRGYFLKFEHRKKMLPLGQFMRVLWAATVFFLLISPSRVLIFTPCAHFFSLWYNGSVLLSEQCGGVSGPFRAHRGGGIFCLKELLFKGSFLKQQMIRRNREVKFFL